MKKTFFSAIALLLIVLAFSGLKKPEINSYEECVSAGYPVLETFPEQCRTPDGKSFTRQIEFCGVSSNSPCSSDSECIASGCSSEVCQSILDEPAITACIYKECYTPLNHECLCNENKCQWVLPE